MQSNNVEGEVMNQSSSMKEAIITPLCKPTPLSKYLALALFIVLPFVGGLVGYNLAGTQIVEVSTVQVQSTSVSDESSESDDEDLSTSVDGTKGKMGISPIKT